MSCVFLAGICASIGDVLMKQDLSLNEVTAIVLIVSNQVRADDNLERQLRLLQHFYGEAACRRVVFVFKAPPRTDNSERPFEASGSVQVGVDGRNSSRHDVSAPARMSRYRTILQMGYTYAREASRGVEVVVPHLDELAIVEWAADDAASVVLKKVQCAMDAVSMCTAPRLSFSRAMVKCSKCPFEMNADCASALSFLRIWGGVDLGSCHPRVFRLYLPQRFIRPRATSLRTNVLASAFVVGLAMLSLKIGNMDVVRPSAFLSMLSLRIGNMDVVRPSLFIIPAGALLAIFLRKCHFVPACICTVCYGTDRTPGCMTVDGRRCTHTL